MENLIFIEGPDKIGKSTICEGLKNILGSEYVFKVLPDEKTRKLINSNDLDVYTKQILQVCSQQNLYYNLRGTLNNYIFDRSILSNFVYSENLQKANLLNSEQLSIITNLNYSVLMQLNKYFKVHFIVLHAEKPFREYKDGSFYEDVVDFNNIQSSYTHWVNLLKHSNYNFKNFTFTTVELLAEFSIDDSVNAVKNAF